MSDVTTIKVPKALRQRLADEARAENTTIAQLLQALLEMREREQRFAAVERAYRNVIDDYAEETAAWEALGDDVPWPR